MLPFSRSMLWLLPLLTLSACGDFMSVFAPKAKPPAVSRAVGSEQYVLNMTLLSLALVPASPDMAEVKRHVKAINAYAAGNKRNNKELAIAVLALECDIKDGEKQTVLAPVPVTGRRDFSVVQQTTRKLSVIPHTLHDVHAYVITLTPANAATLSTDNLQLLRYQLRQRTAQFMDSATPLPLAENARLQLDLVQFFIENRQRDAAYLALENAKLSLAGMAGAVPDGANTAALSKEAAALEETLHRDMPYKL